MYSSVYIPDIRPVKSAIALRVGDAVRATRLYIRDAPANITPAIR
jgi:hypothetical protein